MKRYKYTSGIIIISALFLWSCNQSPLSQICSIPMKRKTLQTLSMKDHRLAVVSYQGISLWDLQTNENLGEIEKYGFARAMVTSPNGFFVISVLIGGDEDGSLKEYLVQSGRIDAKHVVQYAQRGIEKIAKTIDGTGYLMSFEATGKGVTYYRLKRQRMLPVWTNPAVCRTRVWALRADGKEGWYVGCDTSEVIHLDSKGKLIHKILTPTFGVTALVRLKNWMVAVGGIMGNVIVFNRSLDSKLYEFERFKDPVHAISTNEAGDVLLASDLSGHIVMWQVDGWKMHGPFYEKGYDSTVLVDPDDSTTVIHWIQGKGICRSKLY